MAFIFGPAIARGDISSLGLYTPFIFGAVPLPNLDPPHRLEHVLPGFAFKPLAPPRPWPSADDWRCASLGVCFSRRGCVGFLLSRVVKQYKKQVKLRGWPMKVPSDQWWSWRLGCLKEASFVVAFLVGCHLLKTETRSLFNFFLSSFVCPMLRFCIPARLVQLSNPLSIGFTSAPLFLDRFAETNSPS